MMDSELAERAKALSTPTRVSILRLLASRSLCVEALARRAGITPSAASQHLRRLTAVGFVRGRRVGYYVHYSLCREALARFAEDVGRLAPAPDLCLCEGACECPAQRKESDNGQEGHEVHPGR